MMYYTFSVTCSICGGPGRGSIRAAVAQYEDNCVHSDPAVCRAYLRQEANKLKAANS